MTATVHDINLGGTTLKQVTNVSPSDGATVNIARASGEPDPAELYGGNAEEVTTLNSGDIATIVGLNTGTFLANGACITSPATLEVPFRKPARMSSTFDATAVHSAMSGQEALVIPTQITASHDDENGASATLEVHWKSTDGITPGVTPSLGNTLVTALFGGMYSLGKAFINTVELPDMRSATINPGITVQVKREGGGVWPVRIYIVKREPTIEIVTEDLDAALARIGYVDAGGNVDIYLRKKKDGSIYELDTATEHIRFRFAEGLQRTNSMTVAEGSNGSGTITINGKALVGATGVTIP